MTTNATNPATRRSNQMLAAIAREVLGLETLETRSAGHLDFHELAVWQIREALRMAYSAGYEDAIESAGKMADALRVVALDPAIRGWLQANDPKALEQVSDAIAAAGHEEAVSGAGA